MPVFVPRRRCFAPSCHSRSPWRSASPRRPRPSGVRTFPDRRVPSAPSLAKVQPDGERPTLTLPLDAESAASDDVVLETDPRKAVGDADRDVTAVVLSHPRFQSRRLDASVTATAKPGPTRDRVTFQFCVEDKGKFTAGTYQGTVLLFGPEMDELVYPVSVTSKWPWWVPAGPLAAVILGFLALAWRSTSPPGPTGTGTNWTRSGAIATVIYAAVAIFATGLTYWSVYVKNDMWGEDPAVQIRRSWWPR